MKKGVKKIMDDSLLPLGILGTMAIGGLAAAFQKKKQKLKSMKKNKFFGHTDNTKKQEKPVAKKKRKKRTIQDVIEDIRELHEKEEDLLMELEEKTDIDEGEE